LTAFSSFPRKNKRGHSEFLEVSLRPKPFRGTWRGSGLVGSFRSFGFFGLSGSENETNQINEIDRINQLDCLRIAIPSRTAPHHLQSDGYVSDFAVNLSTTDC
jgi:hypothetical protein